MTFKEKMLIHQIHPAKLATDLLAAAVSLYFFWQHQLATGLAVHFLPPVIASSLLVRYAALEPYQQSPFGLNYSKFIDGLAKAGLVVDRKVLSDLAIHEPAAFQAIVEKAKAALPAQA